MTMLQSERKESLAKLIAAPLAAMVFVLQACSPIGPISNPENVAGGDSYQAQYREENVPADNYWQSSSSDVNASNCKPEAPVSNRVLPDAEVLSPGDLLTVSVPDDEAISGKYNVSQDGSLKLMHVAPIQAAGRTVEELEEDVRNALINDNLYKDVPRVSIRVSDFAPARLFVTGAVFEPRSVTIGASGTETGERLRQDIKGARVGDRRLSRALQAAGGIRPDADLSRISVTRGKRKIVVDARPALQGKPYSDIVLLEGDIVDVPSRGCFQEALMKPSPIAPPGVKVFMSNLVVPAASNANSAVGKETRELRYGTRFLQAIFAMNCVGGTTLTNSDRTAVLFSRNPTTGKSIVITRRVEDMLRRADRDDFDPYLMPDDALACYDSSVTNISDVAKILGVIAVTTKAISIL